MMVVLVALVFAELVDQSSSPLGGSMLIVDID